MSKRPKELGRDKAYEQILADIIFGGLPAGASVDEKGLAQRYGLGLASVREALQRLSLEGLIERISRRGTRIAALELGRLHAVFEARVIVEERCAALAAERASAADIRAMKDAFAGYEAVIRSREFRMLVSMDRKFHQALGTASKNPPLAKMQELLHKDAMRFWYFGLLRLDPGEIRADIASHLSIVAAVERRDPSAAAAAMREVLGHFPDMVRTFMSGAMLYQHERPADERHKNERRKAAWRLRKRPEKAPAPA
jgi:DNA-binding GntR family transcriptional regulator